MKPHEVALLDIIGRALFGASVSLLPDTDMSALGKEVCDQTVPILVLQALTAEERRRMDPATADSWTKKMLMHSGYNLQLLYEQEAVLTLLKEHNIPCAVLKGSSVACHYPDPTQRIMGDIDLLVPPDRQMETVRILQADGYGEILTEEHHCHYTVSKDRISVEVHREPNGIHIVTDKSIAARLHGYFTDALSDVYMIGGIPVLAVRHQAVVLLLHKLEHFLSGGLGLRQLCDWACFVKARFTPAEFEALRPFLTECGLLEFAGLITRVCCDWLHLPAEAAPWCMDFDRELACDVMEAIIENGNFGQKEKSDSYGRRFFVDHGSSNRVTSVFCVVGRTCRIHWPVCDRHKILMLIAPFVVGMKYLRLRMRGERPAFHPVKQYRKAGSRQRLYRSLKPFQGE